MYKIKTASRRVEKEMADLPHQVRERIIQAIHDLATEPRPHGARKLAGELRGVWRIRVGDYRVLYDVNDDHKLIVLLAVLHRREAYR